MLSKALGIYHADHCKGIHVNMLAAAPCLYNPWHLLQLANAYLPFADQCPVFLSAQEISWLKDTKKFTEHESGGQPCLRHDLACTPCSGNNMPYWTSRKSGGVAMVIPTSLGHQSNGG